MVHAGGEHDEAGADPAPDKGVGGDGAVGVHEVDVDDVVEALEEDDHDAGAGKGDGDDLRPDGHVRVAGPGEPEETDGQEGAADEHGDETFFGHDVTRALHARFEAVFGDGDDDTRAETDAAEKGDEGERSHARRQAATLLEGDGEGFEEEVARDLLVTILNC